MSKRLSDALHPWVPARLRRQLRYCLETAQKLRNAAIFNIHKAKNSLVKRRPQHVIFCGAPGSGIDTLFSSVSSIMPTGTYAPSQEVTALETMLRFSNPLLTHRALDLFCTKEINSEIGELRDLHFVLCVRDPRSLVCSRQATKSTVEYFQGFDYQLQYSGRTRSYSYPGVVATLRKAIELSESEDLHCSLQRYEDFVTNPEQTALRLVSELALLPVERNRPAKCSKIREQVERQQISDQDMTLWLRPEHRKRVMRQLYLCPELEDLAVRLGYPSASAYGIDLTALPPEADPGTIIAFHTDDDIYRAEAQRFTSRLDELGLKYDMTVVPPRGEWVENCAMKPEFILEARKRLRGPLLYIDVDAYVHSDPWPYLSHYTSQMAAYVHTTGVLNSATLFLSDSPLTEQLLDEWVTEQKRQPKEWDQRVLQQIVERDEASGEPNYEVGRLPANLNYLFDREYSHFLGTAVIEQLQVSREVTAGKESALINRRDRMSELFSGGER